VDNRISRLTAIYRRLIKASQAWAGGSGFDPEAARQLRREAFRLNHAHYLECIPVYRKLAQEEGCGEAAGIPAIKRKLMLADDIFKSYSRKWLDEGDFRQMDQWLSGLFHRPIETQVRGLRSVDDWLEGLKQAGVEISYSSGTSGAFSFVPRETRDQEWVKIANTGYLTSLLTSGKTGRVSSRALVKSAARLLSPESFARAVGRAGLRDFDGIFLGFRSGRMGNQVLIQELAPLFRRTYYLYDIDLTLTGLRGLRPGAQSAEEASPPAAFQAEVDTRRSRNYAKILDRLNESTCEGQKVFLFGAPFQFQELCGTAGERPSKITLNRGSLVLFGGGWKSFRGEALDRDSLVSRIAETFNIPPDRIMEGYSMTEINVLMLRCEAGRFHIPPLIEPVIYDEALTPLEGKDLTGVFGFLDPLAASYPGFIITGDRVRLVDAECPCGLGGPALTQIGRAPGREIKGCGGIMGSIQA
jgi:hypothetical protein